MRWLWGWVREKLSASKRAGEAAEIGPPGWLPWVQQQPRLPGVNGWPAALRLFRAAVPAPALHGVQDAADLPVHRPKA
ncbi:MAG TPA: hypothetical protein VLG48_07900, partial [Candidatus Methylomirabilis sp.]|nr:hypothetical protein [Candidatus Methylomirabilis sp.]